jgi:RNA polymerase sigma factor (TIGR02999 family)
MEHARQPADPDLPLRLRAARTMRQVLVDHARRRVALRRGVPAPLADDVPAAARDAYLVDLDAALAELAQLAPDVAQVVELRFFGGCSVEEAADALGLSPRTVKRRWQLAKGWLHREISK